MSEQRAVVTRRRKISPIWTVPIVAIVLGAWMVVYTWRNEGPEIEISFVTADGIEAGKTKIKARSVDVGLVESVALADGFERVVVKARLDRSALPLLREDTQFWVVRARVGAAGISGLGTIVSGGYIELSPGSGSSGRRKFVGLEAPPVTPAGTPGLELRLVSDRAGSVGAGDPILYKGYRVGRIESAEFDVSTQQLRYRAFIDEPYGDLVTTSTRFWNMSGVSFSATAEGIDIQTGSLETLLFGGVSFGLPANVEAGKHVEDGTEFVLFPDRKSIDEHPYRHFVEYVVEFSSSVRGLAPGAPVEYRGLRTGVVDRILVEEAMYQGMTGEGRPIPVLIRLEPGRIKLEDSPEGVATLRRAIDESVENGLRATLSTGSLLTGSLYVALDVYGDERPATVGEFDEWPTIPTIPSGLGGIEKKVTSLLDKLNELPLEDVARSADDTLRSADQTLRRLERVVADLNALLTSEDVQSLPGSVRESLAELDRALKNVGSLADALEEEPSSLVFPRRREADPEPSAGGP